MKIKIILVANEKARIDYLKDSLKSKNKRNEETIVMTPEVFAKVFSPARFKILMAMANKKSGSITALAKLLGRRIEVVYRDLKLFEEIGLVKMTKEKRSVIPELMGEIQMPVIT